LTINKPNDGGGESDQGRESLSEFVVAGGDTAKLLDPAEESLNEISTFVTVFVELTLNAPVAARWDDRLNVGGVQIVEDGITVVGFVSTDRAGIQALQERERFGAITGFSARQRESSERTQTFHHGMNLRTQPTSGTSERLIAVFLPRRPHVDEHAQWCCR